MAEQFARERLGFDPAEYRSATLFRVDQTAKTFLEKEVGVERTSALAQQVDLWHFTTRYFRPLQREELQVAVGPDGRVTGFRHVVDEAAPGARLERGEALRRAEALRQEMAPLGEWRLVAGTSTVRPARVDWRFTWERADLRADPAAPPAADEARARVEVVVQGDQPGELRQLLNVPERWQREYERIRSANSLVQVIDEVVGTLPLALAMLWVIARRFALRDLRWRLALGLGAVGALLGGAGFVNELPGLAAGYQTNTSWEGFIAQTALLAVLGGLAQGLIIGLGALAGEPLYRERFPGLLSLGGSFSPRGALTRAGALALLVGALLAPVMAAYQLAYYTAGRAIGFWSPADLGYENIYSAPAPWLLPVQLGYTASTFEEFAFRLFAIPFLAGLFLRVVKRTGVALWGAIVVTAVIWGFLHSTYPQDPFFARGLEVTLPGIVFGWLMVRFGILAALSVHYTFDAFVSSVVLDNANTLPTSLTAYALAAIPLAVALFAVARARLRGGYPAAAPMLNQAQPRVEPMGVELVAAEPAAGWAYPALTTTRRRVAAGLGVAGLAAVIALSRAPEHPARFGRAEAEARAGAALAATGVDLAGYRTVGTLESRAGELGQTYLREVGGQAAVEALYGPVIPTVFWQVRLTRPLVRDEYRVQVLPDAAPGDPPFAIVYDLAETTPGARLTGEVARRAAEQELAGRPGWSAAVPVLIDQTQVERPARIEHSFVFEQPGIRYGEATVRADLQVLGARVSGYRPFVKLPEAWERARTGGRLQDAAAVGVVGVVGLALVLLAIARLLRLARSSRLAVRPAGMVAAAFAVLSLVDQVNAWPTFFAGYQTHVPEETFVTGRLTGIAAGLALSSLGAGLLAMLLVGLWRERAAPRLVPTERRRAWGIDAVLLGLGLPLAAIGAAQAVARLGLGAGGAGGGGAPTGMAALVPALAEVASARWAGLGAAGLLASYFLLRERLGRDRWVLLFALALAANLALLSRSLVDALQTFGAAAVAIIALAAAARWLLRANLAAYLLAAVVFALLGGTLSLLRAQDAFLFANGLGLLVVIGGLIGAIVAYSRVSASISTPSEAERWPRSAY